MYGVNTNDLRIFAGLGHETGPDLDFTWENIKFPQEFQIEFINLLKNLTRTGTVTLPESVALIVGKSLVS